MKRPNMNGRVALTGSLATGMGILLTALGPARLGGNERLNSAAIADTGIRSGPAVAGAQSPVSTVEGDWSPGVTGVRGRLIATATEEAGRPQLRLELELQNVRDVANPVEICDTPRV